MFILPLGKRKDDREFVMPEGLSRSERKELKEIIKTAQKTDGSPRTAQQTIPFERMFPDGICRIGADYYTKTIQFQDINYQLAQQEDKTEIFEEWCSFQNFFDSSVHFELSFMNFATEISDFEKKIAIKHRDDGFDEVRDEYSRILLKNMEAGNNGLTKTKYITFGIHADNIKSAKPRLMHIEMDILNNFKRLGVLAKALNGQERLELMHRQLHVGDSSKFRFDWKYLVKTGLSVKDFIAPSSFEFPTGRYGKKILICTFSKKLGSNGKIKESMSFPTFKFKELVMEEWEDSTFGNYLRETRFLFVVYKFDKDEVLRLKGAQFWNIPYTDLP